MIKNGSEMVCNEKSHKITVVENVEGKRRNIMPKTNTVLTIPKPGQVKLVERPYPKIKSGYAIIKTEIAPICLEGSRIWSKHDFEFHDDPEHLGHEGVGTISEIHPGSRYQVGDRVIVFQGDHCGQCHACRNALSPTYCHANLPQYGGNALKGIEDKNDSESGGFAMATHRIAPIENLYKIPDDVDFRYAAVCNCSFGVGFSNQELMGVKAGDTLLIGGGLYCNGARNQCALPQCQSHCSHAQCPPAKNS